MTPVLASIMDRSRCHGGFIPRFCFIPYDVSVVVDLKVQ
jgi:hypothetical protein